MRASIERSEKISIVVGDNSADKSVADDENWFAQAAAALLDQKAGTALHYITGFDERSCQRYAAGTVKPPAYFLRSLLRSDHGWTWLAAVMDGSTAPWWVDIQYARRVSTALNQIEKGVSDAENPRALHAGRKTAPAEGDRGQPAPL